MLFILDSQIQMSQLHADLKSFGLNPSEWSLLKEESHSYKVQSKEDKGFVFAGVAARKGKKLKWKKLELVSI